MAEDLPTSSMSLKTVNKLMRQLNNTPQLLIFWFIEWALKLTSSLAQEIQKVNGAGSVRDYIQKKKRSFLGEKRPTLSDLSTKRPPRPEGQSTQHQAVHLTLSLTTARPFLCYTLREENTLFRTHSIT